MFQRLNKMFVGEVNTSSNQEPEFSEKEDDEWILVDFIDTCTGFSAAEDEEEEDISEESPTEHPSVFSCLPASLECLTDTSDSCFLQFESCPMEESWFITPPPCFTAGGLTTIKVETSPMENLLIEHPSMSVYAVHNPCPSLSEAHCGTEEFHNPSSPRVEAQNEMGQHIHCYVAALAAHTAFLEQPKSFRPSQWIKEHSERQSLNRNSLRRQNLTRDCHSRQIKHNGWAVHQPCPHMPALLISNLLSIRMQDFVSMPELPKSYWRKSPNCGDRGHETLRGTSSSATVGPSCCVPLVNSI